MTQSKGLVVEITRTIKAPRERVFDAFTIPEQIVKWMGPEESEAIFANVDLRVGGEFRYRIPTESRGEIEAYGVFREIMRPSRLVFTWRWDNPDVDCGETLITVDFKQTENGTELRFRHEGFPTIEDRDGHNDGWNLTLDKLEELFGQSA